MKIFQIKINQQFETHSGRVFERTVIKGRGSQKDKIVITDVETGEIFSEKDFERIIVFEVNYFLNYE